MPPRRNSERTPSICTTCGSESPAGARFCMHCAAPLPLACGECGAAVPTSARFCPQCAHPVGAPVSPDSERAAPSPASYTPRHLAEKILTSRVALEGERKQVTVLFADVKSSMELAEQVDSEEWHKIMDRFFAILTDGVHRFEGTVNQYTGDGIMALFGAPIAHEDHAQRACYAALHLSEELRRYADQLRMAHGLNFSVRMGLNSGDVVVGTIGDDLRMDYTAQGHTVGLAQRMEQLAEPGKVYLSEHTATLVGGYFSLRDLGRTQVKGVQEPLGVFALEGAGRLRTRFEVSRARGLTRFVDRDNDLAALDAALASARQGNGQVVGVVGEAGLGKSRLGFEFLERCRAQGLQVLEGHAVAHGKNIPFLPMLQVFRAYYGITEQDSDRMARDKIAGRLLLLDESFREVLPVLFEFFAVPDPDRPPLRLDPEVRQRQLFAVLRRLVRPESQTEPAVTLIEDLHWIDGGSEAFLEQWVEAIGGACGLLLLNFRPEYHAGWMQKSYYRQIRLAPLGPEAVRALLDDLLGRDPSLNGLADAIHARTAGNPFFTEEVVQSLISAGQLEGSKGAYRLVTPVDTIEVPSTVQAVLAARIDRLAEREKQVLQTAAVIGKEFSEPVLQRVVGAVHEPPLLEAELAAALHSLSAAEFVYEQALYPAAEYAFKHPLTQEVAYQSQLRERRGRAHAAAARAITELHADQLDERAALLAHHWEAAGEALTAARWYRRAAEWAGRSDPTQGMRHMRRVLALTDGLDASDERSALRLDACQSLLIQGGWRVGLSSEEVEQLFTEGRELTTRSADADKTIGLYIGYATVVGLGGDVRRYHEIARETFDLIDARVSPGPTAILLVAMSYSSFCLGRLRNALEFAERVPSAVKGDPNAGIETAGFSALGWSFQQRAVQGALLGCLDDARVLLREAIRLARSRDPGDVLIWSLGATGHAERLAAQLQERSA